MEPIDPRDYPGLGIGGLLVAAQLVLLGIGGFGPVGWLALVGVSLVLVALVFLIVPVVQFKRHGGVARGDIFANTTVVVDTGLYAVVRHPQFLAMPVLVVGIALLAQRLDAVLVGAAAVGAFLVDFRRADRRDIAKFGQAYREYAQRVPGWNPIAGLWRLRSRVAGRGMGGYAIVRSPVPEALNRIVDMHDSYYGSHWGFGPAFTRKNLAELSEFLDRFNPGRDGLWTAQVDGRIEGSVAIDGSQAIAELRWFLVSDSLRGRGAGSQLLDLALTFCRNSGFSTVRLWTFAGLDQARWLYDRAGFVLQEQRLGTRWGTEVLEQRLELDL